MKMLNIDKGGKELIIEKKEEGFIIRLLEYTEDWFEVEDAIDIEINKEDAKKIINFINEGSREL